MSITTPSRITPMRILLVVVPLLALAACGGGGGGGGTAVGTPADAAVPTVVSVAAANADGAGGPTVITVVATDNVGVSQVTAQVSGFSAPGATNPVTLTLGGANTFTGSIVMMSGDIDPTPFTVSVTVRDAAGNSASGTAGAQVLAAALPPATP